MSTIAQVFANKGLWAWFNSTVTNKYDGSSEKGQDYANAFGTPIAVPVGGQIVRSVHNDNSIGDVVELQDANGAVWLYQHITAKVKVGDSLQCGSIIGTENGLPVDQYSTGPHIEVRYCPSGWNIGTDSWNEPWVNPASIFNSIGAQTAGAVSGNVLTALAGAITGSGGAAAPITLAPNADVTVLLGTLDQLMLLTDPFKVGSVQQDTIAGVTFTDPVAWATQFGVNLIDDLTALTLRAVCLALGVFVIYKVLSAFIDFGAITQTVTSGAATVAKAGVLLA